MQTDNHPPVTRRSFLKVLAGGATTSFLIATSRAADARIRSYAQRETGSAPVISTLQPLKSTSDIGFVCKRFERRMSE